MYAKARWVVCSAVALVVAGAFAQEIDDQRYDEQGRPKRSTEIPTAGFWPTERMTNRVIDRITGKMADEYDFDDSQLRLTREIFKARFPTFLNENRAEIQTLLNQYLEAILDDQPPAVEDVAYWAQRVQPLLAEFEEVCHEVGEGMREYLNEDQEVLLDAQVAAFQTGVRMAQNKLGVWAEGGYDPETEWIHRGGGPRQSEGAEAPGGPGEDEAEGQAQPGAKTPKDEWTIYTEQFIERYQLNAEQKQKAYAFLRRQQEERDRYLRQKTDEMEEVTKRLQAATTEEERKAAVAQYDRLTAPVERMFERLKERLDTLPTRAQRRAAEPAEPEAESRPSAPGEGQTEEKEEKKDDAQPESTPAP
jgi:hypothetical protein